MRLHAGAPAPAIPLDFDPQQLLEDADTLLGSSGDGGFQRWLLDYVSREGDGDGPLPLPPATAAAPPPPPQQQQQQRQQRRQQQRPQQPQQPQQQQSQPQWQFGWPPTPQLPAAAPPPLLRGAMRPLAPPVAIPPASLAAGPPCAPAAADERAPAAAAAALVTTAGPSLVVAMDGSGAGFDRLFQVPAGHALVEVAPGLFALRPAPAEAPAAAPPAPSAPPAEQLARQRTALAAQAPRRGRRGAGAAQLPPPPAVPQPGLVPPPASPPPVLQPSVKQEASPAAPVFASKAKAAPAPGGKEQPADADGAAPPKRRAPSQRFRDRQKALISSLERGVAARLAQLQLLSDENAALRLQSSILETAVQGRDMQISVIRDFGGVNWGDDAPPTPPPTGGGRSGPGPARTRSDAGSCLSTGRACGFPGGAGDAPPGPPAFGDAAALDPSADRGSGAGSGGGSGGGGSGGGGSGGEGSACFDSSGGGGADGGDGGGGPLLDESGWLRLSSAPASCPREQQRRCIEHIKWMAPEEVRAHWRDFLGEVSSELMSLQQQEEAAAAALAAQPAALEPAHAGAAAAAAAAAAASEPPPGQPGTPAGAPSGGGWPEAAAASEAGGGLGGGGGATAAAAEAARRGDTCPRGTHMALPEGSVPGGALERIHELVSKHMFVLKHVLLLNPGAMAALSAANLDTGEPAAAGDDYWRAVVSQLRLTPQQVADVVAVHELYARQASKVLAAREALQRQLSELLAGDPARCGCGGGGDGAGVAGACAANAGAGGGDDAAAGAGAWPRRPRGACPATASAALEVLEGLARSFRREYATRLMLNCAWYNRVLTGLQLAQAAVFSFPLFPDVPQMVAVIAADAAAAAAGARGAAAEAAAGAEGQWE
ncbi:hypothetical protein Rsub_05662 [Raphidocelis subcapitata]|uniref:BZIP domain-containing protein n=1 Tax=Raphidocelis subcapitata TaxID=307507 RepID=A0A2V0NZI3_9CHLO|nr:hypothetical protein Rsub_05662 [Raphidocelis subcapitata]|eukprot:GBF93051.1 hypothetical protein Rsub_05662 [Raphidocelis subcapitata]